MRPAPRFGAPHGARQASFRPPSAPDATPRAAATCCCRLFTEAGRLATPLAANAFKALFANLLFAALVWITSGVPWRRRIAPADVAVLAPSGVARVMSERRDEARGRSAHPLLARMSATPGAGHRHPLEGRIGPGVLITLGAALGQAVAALLAKPALERVPNLEATEIRVVAAVVGMLAIGLGGGRLPSWSRLIVRRRLIPPLVLASCLGPFIGLWLMTVALAGVAVLLVRAA